MGSQRDDRESALYLDKRLPAFVVPLVVPPMLLLADRPPFLLSRNASLCRLDICWIFILGRPVPCSSKLNQIVAVLVVLATQTTAACRPRVKRLLRMRRRSFDLSLWQGAIFAHAICE